MNRTREALASLVSAGTLTEEQATAVSSALEEAGQARELGRRRIISEILSYVGGALVVVSGAFIVAQTWEPLGAAGRSALIAAIAAILFAAGWFLSGRVHDDPARRLASTLMTAAAALAALAVWNTLDAAMGHAVVDTPNGPLYDPERQWIESFTVMCSAVSCLVVATIGYIRSHSALGHIAMGASAGLMLVSAAATVTSALTDSDEFPVAGSVLLLAMGAAWLVASLRGLFAERVVGQFVGIAALFMGTQGLRDAVDAAWVIPAIMLVGGLLLMAAYGYLRQWPLLVGGVGGVIVGGAELLIEYTEGIVAAVGILALGLVMLAAGLRLLRERRPPAAIDGADAPRAHEPVS